MTKPHKTYLGTVSEGKIVLDPSVKLREGISVRVEVIANNESHTNAMTLRGTPYTYENPFDPAVSTEQWDASR